jgi:hypothetical protein
MPANVEACMLMRDANKNRLMFHMIRMIAKDDVYLAINRMHKMQ